MANPNKIARFMDTQLPDRIRLQPLTGKKTFLQGKLNPRRLQRIPGFNEVIAVHDVGLELAVETRESGLFLLDGRISARMELVCQRCLQPYSWLLDDPIRLTAGNGPGPESDERVELADDEVLDVVRLIEDELIIRLPRPPVHTEPAECDPDMLQRGREFDSGISTAGRRENPFAVLKKGKT